jgi:hypothetical protein
MENNYNEGIWTEQEYKIFEEVLNQRLVENRDFIKKRAEDFYNVMRKARGENYALS